MLGADQIEIQSYTNSIVTYFALFATLGAVSYGQREIAMHRNNAAESSRLFWEIEFLSVCTAFIATAAWLVFAAFSSTYTSFYLVLTFSMIAVAFDISWYFSGLERFNLIVIRNTVVRLAGVALLFFLIHQPSDLLFYITALAVTGLLGNISMWTYLPGRVGRVAFGTLHPFRNVKQTLAYFIPAIAASVHTALDKTMIGILTGSEMQNGYYSS